MGQTALVMSQRIAFQQLDRLAEIRDGGIPILHGRVRFAPIEISVGIVGR